MYSRRRVPARRRTAPPSSPAPLSSIGRCLAPHQVHSLHADRRLGHDRERQARPLGDVERRGPPSAMLITHSRADSSSACSARPPNGRYRPRRPSCGSPFGVAATSVASSSSTIEDLQAQRRACRRGGRVDRAPGRRPRCGGATDRSWPERVMSPDRQVEAGEQYCRSSLPYGENSIDLVAAARGHAALRDAGRCRRRPDGCACRRAGRLADAGQHQPGSDAGRAVLVARQPGDRADRARARTGNGTCSGAACASARPGARRRPRPERLSLASEGWQTWLEIRISSAVVAGQHALAVGQAAVLERGVDDRLVLAVGQGVEVVLAEAEAPVLGVVRRPVRNPVGWSGSVCRCGRSSSS